MKIHPSFFALLSSVLLALAPRVAAADPRPADPRPDNDHVEFSMGFLAGAYDHHRAAFTSDNNTLPGSALQRDAYDHVTAMGLRYDLRAVVSHVRMTVGFDVPFTSLAGAPVTMTDGHSVRPEVLQDLVLRFGLGGEYSFGRVTPFADLLGAVHWVHTSVAVDGHPQSYDARDFGFSARGGLRYELRRWLFVAAAGEVGLTGPLVWSADLMVGFAIR